jgi:outer membrane receptor protein involved in Fe transport
MKKALLVSLFLVAVGGSAFAQFPGGPGGRPSGDGFGRQRPTSPEVPGTAVPGTEAPDATPRGNAKITGFVVDSALTKAVEFANVALYDRATNKPVDGTVADAKGKFTLSRQAAGTYKLMISFLGFATKTIDNITLAKGQALDLGAVRLSAQTTTLAEVTVTGQAALIEEKVDRLVYNADKDINAKGGDATEILRKVPMLSVDLDGNLSLRGSSNIRVLINNKPSTILASSIADALKQIPADQIKSVEVITSPSARYDAEGSSGIVNIITKKNTLQGTTLNVDAGVGVRGSNLSLNGGYRRGKLGLTLGGFGRAFYNPAETSFEQTTPGGVRTTQSATAFDRGLFGRYSLGLDYDLAKNQSITANVSYGTRNFRREQDLTINQYQNNVLGATQLRHVDSRNPGGTVDVSVDYLRTFKPGQEWSVSTLFSRTDQSSNFDALLSNPTGGLLGRQQNFNASNNQEITLQTDYLTPLSKWQQLEFGAKGIFRTVLSDYRYLLGTGGSIGADASVTGGSLDYSQNIAAGYLAYTLTTAGKITVKLGTRYEHTFLDASTRETGAATPGGIALPDYANLVPSVNVSKVLGKSTLKVAYNRRIQRPGLMQLNPNVNAANPQNITVGNPALRPELTDNVELSWSKNLGKAYVTTAVFARQTNNAITQVSRASDTLAGALVTTFQNIGRERAVGANLFGNLTITPRWTLNGSIDGYFATLTGQVAGLNGTSVTLENSGFVIGGRLSNQFSFKNGWMAQIEGGTRGNRVQLQGYQTGFYMYSMGVRKEFAQKKLSLGLAAENFIGSGMRIRTVLQTPQFDQLMQMRLFNQNVKLTVSYKIGKMSMNAPKRRTRSVKNDDVKAGESSN